MAQGIKDANDELIPLEHGSVVQGEMESIDLDYSKASTAGTPFIVSFLFKANGQTHICNVGNIFDPVHKIKKPGDPVWVVYMPDDPDLSSVWPPLK